MARKNSVHVRRNEYFQKNNSFIDQRIYIYMFFKENKVIYYTTNLGLSLLY